MTKQYTLAIWLERNEGFCSKYAHLRGTLCESELRASDNRPEYPHYAHETLLAGLSIYSQADSTNKNFYAMSIGLSTDAGDLTTLDLATRAVKVLKPIDTKMRKMSDLEGAHEDIATWINRIARAIGAKHVFVKNDEKIEARTGTKYRKVPVGADLVSRINWMVRELFEDWNPEKKAA